MTHLFPPRAEFPLAAAAAVLAACSHYTLPPSRLESPEARGIEGFGRLEGLGFQTTTDLSEKPYPVVKPSETPYLQAQRHIPDFLFGANVGWGDRIDVGARFHTLSPPVLRAKYQFAGEPESRSEPGNWSAAAVAAGGLMLGSGKGDSSVTFSLVDLSLIGGYRLWSRHLFSVAPFFSIAGVDGEDKISASQLGGALGYQYTARALWLRLETSYILGGSLSGLSGRAARISGVNGGFLLGLVL